MPWSRPSRPRTNSQLEKLQKTNMLSLYFEDQRWMHKEGRSILSLPKNKRPNFLCIPGDSLIQQNFEFLP